MIPRVLGLLLLAIFAFQIAACTSHCACSISDNDGCVCCGQAVAMSTPASVPPQALAESLAPTAPLWFPDDHSLALLHPPRS